MGEEIRAKCPALEVRIKSRLGNYRLTSRMISNYSGNHEEEGHE